MDFLSSKGVLHPNAILMVRFNNSTIDQTIVYKGSWFFYCIYCYSLFWCIEGSDFTTSIGGAASSLGNVGPGLGDVGPSKTFSNLSMSSGGVQF